MPISLRARIVFPVDAEPIDGGVVTIDGERIVAVGPATEASGTIRDLGEVALLPALVNAHTHLEFSHLHAPLGRAGMPLIEWLPLAIAERSSRANVVDHSLAQGIQESLLSGICAVGEIATADAACYPADGGLSIVRFLEVIGFSRARATSAFAALGGRLSSRRSSEQLVGLSPHAPYTVSPDLLAKLVQLAREQRLPVAMHLAESEEELELIAAGAGPFRELLEARSMWDAEAIPAGTRPIDYLHRLRESPRALVIHGNYLQRDEHEFLAANAERMTLVYCPRTHAYFRHPPYRLADLVRLGVRVALGTDSRASNPDLDMLGEVRHLARNHAEVPAAEVLKMATLHGAMALGCDGECGSVTPGKLANLVAIPTNTNSLSGALVGTCQPTMIWFRGREL